MWRDEIEHHLSLGPLGLFIVDTLGPLPEDLNGFSIIVVIVDNFTKLAVLARSTTSNDFIGTLIQCVSIFGVPKEIRSNGGS